MAVAPWMAYNLIVIITTSACDEYQRDATRRDHPQPLHDDFSHPKKGFNTPLITIFHLLNEIMLITYIALCKKEIYKD